MSELTFEMLDDGERAILAELLKFGHNGQSFAVGTLERGRRFAVVESIESRLTPAEVHELCQFVRVAARRAVTETEADEHKPDVYDAEDFFAWCFEPEPENRRPGPRVSITAEDADHARQLFRSIQQKDRLRELFFLWDHWRRTTGR